VRTRGFGTLMDRRKTSLNLPLSLQFLAAWIRVRLGPVARRERLDGMLKFYHREKA